MDFDFGTAAKNLEVYGQEEPRVYELRPEVNTVPAAFIVGKHDLLIPPEFGKKAFM